MRSPDPTQAMKSWWTAWRKLTVKAGLKGFRLHESKASEQTILSLAGHVSKRMLEHYSHIRREAKRRAARRARAARGVTSQNHVTERGLAGVGPVIS